MNSQIKHLQARMYSNKNLLESIPDSDTESYDNSADPSNSIKGRKSNKQKRSKSEWTNRVIGTELLDQALKSPKRLK